MGYQFIFSFMKTDKPVFTKSEVRKIIYEELKKINEAVDHDRAAALASLAADIAASVAKIREKVTNDFPMLSEKVDGPLNELSKLADDIQTNSANPNYASIKQKKTIVLKPEKTAPVITK